MIISVAAPVTRKPPRNNQGSKREPVRMFSA
jgi:hypothetical protein